MHVLIGRLNGFYRNVVIENDLVEETIKAVGVPACNQQTAAVSVNFRLNNGILLKDQRGNERWTITADEDVYRMIIHFVAHALDFALCDDVSIAHHDDA